jgi:hypothetical protein
VREKEGKGARWGDSSDARHGTPVRHGHALSFLHTQTDSMAAATELTYLAPYLTAVELAQYNNPKKASTALWGKMMILDAPIKDIDRLMAKILADVWHNQYRNYSVVLGNEGGALIGALLVAGYSPQEIIALRASGELDPITLIEGGQVLTGKMSLFHKRTGGADHKGKRFRDKVNELLRAKLAGSSDDPVRFGELMTVNSSRGTGLLSFGVKVFDSVSGMPIVISGATHPTMPVADAILSSCAVVPYISGFAYTDAGGVEHTYWSCSGISNLPIVEVMSTYKALRAAHSINAALESLLVGYGYSGTTTLVGDEVGATYASVATTVRPVALVPSQYVPFIRMYGPASTTV